jgi:hypothetical protein
MITSSILIINLTTCVPRSICCFLISRFEISNSFSLSCHLSSLQSMPSKDFFLYIVWLWLLLLYWWVIGCNSFTKVIEIIFLHPKNLVSTCFYNHKATYLCRPISIDNRIIPSQVTCINASCKLLVVFEINNFWQSVLQTFQISITYWVSMFQCAMCSRFMDNDLKL